MKSVSLLCFVAIASASLVDVARSRADEPPVKAFVDGTGPGWRELGEADFVNVNCHADTWTWKDGVAHCTGQPVGVIRSKKQVHEFRAGGRMAASEIGRQLGHLCVDDSRVARKPQTGQPAARNRGAGPRSRLQDAVRAQGKKADWFTTNGDVFRVGQAKLTPFPPISPDGSRSFPRKELSKGINQWNHYYVRAINGEIRLWVNGEEVSGGSNADPRVGYLCLESEGSPVEFRNLRLRELP